MFWYICIFVLFLCIYCNRNYCYVCNLASQRQFTDGSLKAHGFQRGEKMLGTDPSHISQTSVDRSSLSPYLPPRAHALHTTLISPLSRVFMLSALQSVVSRPSCVVQPSWLFRLNGILCFVPLRPSAPKSPPGQC